MGDLIGKRVQSIGGVGHGLVIGQHQDWAWVDWDHTTTFVGPDLRSNGPFWYVANLVIENTDE